MTFLIKNIFFATAFFCLSFSAFAIQDGDFRIGIQSGNMVQQGTLATQGPLLGYGGNFGYMFSDDMLFEIDGLVGSSKDFSQTQINMGVAYYFLHHNTVYYDIAGGMNIVNNSVSLATSEKITGGSSGIYAGLGLDYDISARITAGFQMRFTRITPTTKYDIAKTAKFPLLDNIMTTFFRLSYVF